MLRGIVSLIYVVLGAFIAQQHHYLAHLDSLSRVASAALAIGLWPLILLQVDLHIR